MANPKPKAPEDAPKESPKIVVEDSVVQKPNEPAKPVKVTELPDGVIIEDY